MCQGSIDPDARAFLLEPADGLFPEWDGLIIAAEMLEYLSHPEARAPLEHEVVRLS
jgi:hypothetical protein